MRLSIEILQEVPLKIHEYPVLGNNQQRRLSQLWSLEESSPPICGYIRF